MKHFNVNATSLTVSFLGKIDNEKKEVQINTLPLPNYEAETVNDSENSEEEEFLLEDGHSYRVVIYKNIAEGSIELFDNTIDEEISDFDIEEHFDENDSNEA